MNFVELVSKILIESVHDAFLVEANITIDLCIVHHRCGSIDLFFQLFLFLLELVPSEQVHLLGRLIVGVHDDGQSQVEK